MMASSQALLSERVLRKFQRGKPVKFPLNEEATSLSIAPSGRFVCGGFTDGTVRMFDLTGYFRNGAPSKKASTSCSATAAAAATTTAAPGSPLPRTSVVDSKRHQKYGAVACQIHAKGVHTSLRMHVELSEDGLWCFAGVLRGSMELLAIHLGDLQNAYQQEQEKALVRNNEPQEETETATSPPNLLDHLTIFRHADAKLRGFGACTRLQNSSRYLLFTGKAIKNIHIWSFDPPKTPEDDPVLVQLYDTSTNGITINFLQFRRHAQTGALQAISKSNDQRLRVWDLTAEENGEYDHDPNLRPSRPPFQDVPNTEGTLAVAGGLCICGGSHMYNQMSLVSLNVENLQSPYNHTELALPGVSASPMLGSSRRTQRGDLKSVLAAYGSVQQAAAAAVSHKNHSNTSSASSSSTHHQHVLLEISDGTLGHYRAGQPQLTVNQRLPWYPNTARTMAVGNIPGTCPVAAVALYQAGGLGKGQLSVWPLEKPMEAAVVQRQPPSVSDALVDTERVSPIKTDEKSVATTATMTPESLVSRPSLEKSSAEKISAVEKSTLTPGPGQTESVENPSIASNSTADQPLPFNTNSEPKKDKKPVLKLILRLPGESKNSKPPKGETGKPRVSDPAKTDSAAVLKHGLAEAKTTSASSTKKKRRFSNDSASPISQKAARHRANDRPHSAPTLLKTHKLPVIVSNRAALPSPTVVAPVKTNGKNSEERARDLSEKRKSYDNHPQQIFSLVSSTTTATGTIPSQPNKSNIGNGGEKQNPRLSLRPRGPESANPRQTVAPTSRGSPAICKAPPVAQRQSISQTTQADSGKPTASVPRSMDRHSPATHAKQSMTTRKSSPSVLTNKATVSKKAHIEKPASKRPAAVLPGKPAVSRKENTEKGDKYAAKTSRPPSPPTAQTVTQEKVATAPKAVDRRTLITPTPDAKINVAGVETWEQLSMGPAAQALSSLKQLQSASVETPILARHAAVAKQPKNNGSNDGNLIKSPLPVAKDPLPAPRVLHATSKSTPRVSKKSTDYESEMSTTTPSFSRSPPKPCQTAAEKTGCVTPLVGNKRKSQESSTPVSAKKPSLPRGAKTPPPKRYKIDSLDWLRPVATLRGRRDDQHMRQAIAMECKRHRVAIERKVQTICAVRASRAMGATEKMQAEHQAAFVFLEKRIWRSVRSLLQSVERAPSIAALHESRQLLKEFLLDYKNTATTMLTRHEIELSSVFDSTNPVSPRQGHEFSDSFDMAMFDSILECFPRVG